MLYEKKAKLLMESQRQSDGMGGWLEPTEPIVIGEIDVASSPVSTELALKEYGLVSTSAMKLYTENYIPMIRFYIEFEDRKYRVIQVANYELAKVILMELM